MRTAFIQERAQKWTHKKSKHKSGANNIPKTPNSCSEVSHDSLLQTLDPEGLGTANEHLDNTEQLLGVLNKRIAETLSPEQDKEGNSKRCRTDSVQKSGWIEGFEARSSVEKIRNCTKIDKDLRDLIVRRVFEAIMGAEDGRTVQLSDGRTWKKGGKEYYTFTYSDIIPQCSYVPIINNR